MAALPTNASGTTSQPQGNLTGPPVTVNLQQMSDSVQALTNLVRAVSALNNTISTHALSVAGTMLALPVSTVAGLPAVTLAQVGALAFASNGRNTGESAGVGTGCTVQVQNKSGTATWCSVWAGIAVTS